MAAVDHRGRARPGRTGVLQRLRRAHRPRRAVRGRAGAGGVNCKNAKQRVLSALVDGTFDPEQGCRWPRDVIAAYAGVSEKTVTRAVAELEHEGLRVVRPRKRG